MGFWQLEKYLTIRLWAWDFYGVIVDEAEGRINYHLIEIESEQSNCFSKKQYKRIRIFQ